MRKVVRGQAWGYEISDHRLVLNLRAEEICQGTENHTQY